MPAKKEVRILRYNRKKVMVKKTELKSGYSIFGNKGNVWSNTAHIYQSKTGNLCGTPALSSNHAGYAGSDAGCEKCCAIYKEQNN